MKFGLKYEEIELTPKELNVKNSASYIQLLRSYEKRFNQTRISFGAIHIQRFQRFKPVIHISKWFSSTQQLYLFHLLKL